MKTPKANVTRIYANAYCIRSDAGWVVLSSRNYPHPLGTGWCQRTAWSDAEKTIKADRKAASQKQP